MPFEGCSVGVLIPAYNEETQITDVVKTVPEFVDRVIVIDDGSTDDTRGVVGRLAQSDERVVLLEMGQNRGVGGALAAGYAWARDNDIDIAVRMDGDGQMDPAEMAALVRPIVRGQAEYTKGNRLLDPTAWHWIPRTRLLGNAILSLLTKMASGYWAVADSQSGYTAAGRTALERIDWGRLYHSYGCPNDVLILANVAECRVADVPITPIYGVGEQSSMKIIKVTFTIAWLLIRRFWWRLFHKYLLREFHPLLFFYLLATVTMLIAGGLFGRLAWLWVANGTVPPMTALALSFFTITGFNSLFFAYWMDMQANAHLSVRLPPPSISRAPPGNP